MRIKNEQCEMVRFLVDTALLRPRTLPDALVISRENPPNVLRADPQNFMINKWMDNIKKITYVTLRNDWTSKTKVKLSHFYFRSYFRATVSDQV